MLGLWELAASSGGYAMYIDYDGNLNALAYTLMFLALGLATLAGGITLLVQARRKNVVVPLVLLAFAALAIPLAVTSTVRGLYGVFPTVLNVLLAVSVLIVLGIGVAKERQRS